MNYTSRYRDLQRMCSRWMETEGAIQVDFGTRESWDGFSWTADCFREMAREVPGQSAVVIASSGQVASYPESCSYRELQDLSDEAAWWLKASGVKVGDVVRVNMRERVVMWAFLLALDLCGAVILQVQPSLSEAQSFQRTPKGVRLWLLDDDSLTSPSGTARRLPVLGGTSHCFNPVRIPAASPLWGYYTSGTTGAPKLVIHSRVGYSIGHLSSVAFHALRPGSWHTNLSGPGWAKFAWSSLYVPLSAGVTYVGMSSVPTEEVLSALKRERVKSVCASPSKWNAILSNAAPLSCELEATFSAGESMSELTRVRVGRVTGTAPRSVFGMTEMTAAMGELESGQGLAVLPGYEARTTALESGVSALEVSPGLALMLGYATSGVTPGVPSSGWLRTGDSVEHCPGTTDRFVVRGRLDDLINVEGHLRSPSDLEAEFVEATGVSEAMVSKASGDGSVSVWACWRGQRLSMSEVPSYVDRIYRVKNLPKTPSGKLRRKIDSLTPIELANCDPQEVL